MRSSWVSLKLATTQTSGSTTAANCWPGCTRWPTSAVRLPMRPSTAEVGQRVQPGQQLAAVVEPEVWVVANFKETQLERMKPGQKVHVKLDAFPGQELEAHVDSFSPASGASFALLPPDNATGNFTKIVQRVPVKLVFEAESLKRLGEAASRIVPGLSAVVEVVVAE
ncbi:MAG: HlyD family secretion protein, partial [Roseateles sp.]